MHSSFLRGSDFQLCAAGQAATHARYFADLSPNQRLGVLAPDGVGGVGAATLILAHVTAFYYRYRDKGTDFFAYPDYYSFQSCEPLADYAMFDIWPPHKNLYVPRDAPGRLDKINDRAINILVLPDKPPVKQEYQPAQLESARRNIQVCYVYSPVEQVFDADLVISTKSTAMHQWAASLFDRGELANDPARTDLKSAWLAQHRDGCLQQSFRTISLDEALQLL